MNEYAASTAYIRIDAPQNFCVNDHRNTMVITLPGPQRASFSTRRQRIQGRPAARARSGAHAAQQRTQRRPPTCTPTNNNTTSEIPPDARAQTHTTLPFESQSESSTSTRTHLLAHQPLLLLRLFHTRCILVAALEQASAAAQPHRT